ncbi:hypothetical protein HYX70_00680 [Candidatus Saccharibacteria bacterium]|nr:hypothetical protein [Candidatus Saccharibacteria bacterium]
MNVRKIVNYGVLTIAAAVVGVGFHAGNVAKAADQPNNKCEVFARSYSVGADTVTATFEVKNTVDSTACTKDVTVAAWDAPNGVDGKPFDQQKFVDSKSGTFPAGFSSLTVKKPQCFYQIDLLRGLSPFGPSGNTNDYTAGQFVSSSHGGAECKPTPPPAPVTPTVALSTPALPTTGGGADTLSVALAGGALTGLTLKLRSLRKNK